MSWRVTTPVRAGRGAVGPGGTRSGTLAAGLPERGGSKPTAPARPPASGLRSQALRSPPAPCAPARPLQAAVYLGAPHPGSVGLARRPPPRLPAPSKGTNRPIPLHLAAHVSPTQLRGESPRGALRGAAPGDRAPQSPVRASSSPLSPPRSQVELEIKAPRK